MICDSVLTVFIVYEEIICVCVCVCVFYYNIKYIHSYVYALTLSPCPIFLSSFFALYYSDGVFVEKNGTDMKGSTIGTSGPRVKAAVARAMGGCLFIDEGTSEKKGWRQCIFFHSLSLLLL